MLTTLLRRFPALLRRAGLLAGLLALISGIFGMHFVPGTHSMAATGAIHAAETYSVERAPDAHTGHHVADTTSAPTPPGPAASCTGSGGCAEMAGMDAGCVPSPGTGSLLAPLPGSTPFGNVSGAGQPSGHADYSFLPTTPSPGDLCISRT